MLNVLKAIIYGIIEGITEWLPISSTGHMILFSSFMPMEVTEEFWNVFLVVIQLGAIFAVIFLYFWRLWPFGLRKSRKKGHGGVVVKPEVIGLWVLILIACLPAAIVGILFDDAIDAIFYNPICVSITLIVFGIAFIVIEMMNRGKKPRIRHLEDIDFKYALIIGVFQLIAAVFPGTSRSGATIIGALLLGVERGIAAEFTFFLAVPVMAGASLLKVVKFLANGTAFTGAEMSLLAVGMIVAFAVSLLVIRLFLGYIRRHDFKPFGWYRIVLGTIVLICFASGAL